jgi:hypothetical protein
MCRAPAAATQQPCPPNPFPSCLPLQPPPPPTALPYSCRSMQQALLTPPQPRCSLAQSTQPCWRPSGATCSGAWVQRLPAGGPAHAVPQWCCPRQPAAQHMLCRRGAGPASRPPSTWCASGVLSPPAGGPAHAVPQWCCPRQPAAQHMLCRRGAGPASLPPNTCCAAGVLAPPDWLGRRCVTSLAVSLQGLMSARLPLLLAAGPDV